MTISTSSQLSAPSPDGRAARWALPHVAKSVGIARHLSRSLLETWGVEQDAVDTALLVVSELVTNAVEHGRAPMALHLKMDQAAPSVEVAVSDGGPASNDGPWTTSCEPEEHGRGNSIVTCLADRQGIRQHAHGMTRWAELPTTG
ncbi:ATP-binding protein [Streptomyces virginiae]|uniref:ATP-binding protein n=1 Tax=Streptomyces virginiae TaxID=1961 RepID=UPI00343B8F6E